MRTGILAAIALSTAAVAAPGHARADVARAWAAAKAGLPADTKLMVGIDIAAIRQTQLFATYYPKLHDKPDAAKVLDAIKDGCKVDPAGLVQGIVFGGTDGDQDGAMYVAINGTDRAKLSSCLQAAVQADDKDAKVSVKQNGNITEVTRGSDTLYFGWIGKDVLVAPFRAKEKAALTKWMGGKGALAKSDLGKLLAKVNTAATLWAVGLGAKEIQPGIDARGGYGAVTYAKGTVNADLHAMLVSPEQATSLANLANQQLDQARNGPMPAEFAALIKAITITAAQDEVRVKASMTEKDVMGALAIALGTLGGL